MGPGPKPILKKRAVGRDNTQFRKEVHFAAGTKDPMPDAPARQSRRSGVADRVEQWRAYRQEALSSSIQNQQRAVRTHHTFQASISEFRRSEVERREAMVNGSRLPRRAGDPRRVSSVSGTTTRLVSQDSRRVRSDSFRATRFGSSENR